MNKMFYVGSDNDADRCRESFGSRKQIAISGIDAVDGTIKPYVGIVTSVEHMPVGSPGQRWRIGIRETDLI
jgi:hypothetical protein